MPSTEEIIQSAVDEAVGDEPDTSDDTGAEVIADADPVVETPAEEVVADPAVEEAKPVVEVDELTAELEALGIKAPKEGERENRLPYSRVKKIVANAQKKLRDSHAATLKERETKFTAAETRAQQLDAIEKMVTGDPRGYMERLAIVNPEFRQFLDRIGVVPEEKKPVVADDPQPEPDGKYADGTTGYTPEGLQKLREWDRRQAVAEAEKRFDARLGPIEKAEKVRAQQQRDHEYRQSQIPVINGQIATASKTWGKAFDEDYAKQESGNSDILKYMQANPDVPFDTCVAAVLVPKMLADRNTMRADVLKEVSTTSAARKGAAAKGPGSATKSGSEAGPQTTEEIIKAAISGLR